MNKKARWCKRCVAAYTQWPSSRNKARGAGLFYACKAAETGEAMLLFGQEDSGEWSHMTGAADHADKDNMMIALREGAEEVCYAFGAPQAIKANYFDTGMAYQLTRNNWLVNLGVLDAAGREAPLKLHKENLNGAFGRPPTPCEREIQELRWCTAKEFEKAVTSSQDDDPVVMPTLGSPCRRCLKHCFREFLKCPTFRAFCGLDRSAMNSISNLVPPAWTSFLIRSHIVLGATALCAILLKFPIKI